APDEHLFVAVLGGRLSLVQALERTVVTLVQTPAQPDGRMHGVHGIQSDPQRADGALQHRAIGQVEFKALFFEQFARLARLLATQFGKVDIGPAGETVFKVPLAFAVAHQDEFVHGKSHLEVNNLRPFYNRLILPLHPFVFSEQIVDFFADQTNILLIIVAVTSAVALALPRFLQRGARQLGVNDAVKLANDRQGLFVDVRNPEQFKAGSVPQARNVPAGDIAHKLNSLPKDK